MIDLKYSEILRRNAALAAELPAETYRIAILSNIIVSPAKDLIEYSLRAEGVPAVVSFGDYDNIVQDSMRFREANLVLVFWEAYNLIDGLQFKAEVMEEESLEQLFAKVVSEVDFVFANLKETSLVLFNSFSGVLFGGLEIGTTALDRLAWRLNEHLRVHLPRNAKLVDVNRIVARVGTAASVDLRYLYAAKAPYTIDFFKAYATYIRPFVLSAVGKAKKALIFDCDNTLWNGILGEDGPDGIEMSAATNTGAIFAEIQALALALNRQGVLLGLCSKNNPEDVADILRSHPDMQIRDEHIAVRRINWLDKVTNLKDMARELNIGIDSLVFVDDSPFEVDFIREQLPQVTVLRVPEARHLYPALLRSHRGLFFSLSSTAEDRRKSAMYAEQTQRVADKARFEDLDDYLASLGTTLTIHRDDPAMIPRVAQMTQKTNQFNLTTRRYTEADIERFVSDQYTGVVAFSVKDRFGDSGVTGLCIAQNNGRGTATIDTFLMSCRVLGRKVEFAFMNWLVDDLRRLGVSRIEARYQRTPKNAQVADFFDRCSFALVEANDAERSYALDVCDFQVSPVEHVEIIDGRSNA